MLDTLNELKSKGIENMAKHDTETSSVTSDDTMQHSALRQHSSLQNSERASQAEATNAAAPSVYAQHHALDADSSRSHFQAHAQGYAQDVEHTDYHYQTYAPYQSHASLQNPAYFQNDAFSQDPALGADNKAVNAQSYAQKAGNVPQYSNYEQEAENGSYSQNLAYLQNHVPLQNPAPLHNQAPLQKQSSVLSAADPHTCASVSAKKNHNKMKSQDVITNQDNMTSYGRMADSVELENQGEIDSQGVTESQDKPSKTDGYQPYTPLAINYPLSDYALSQPEQAVSVLNRAKRALDFDRFIDKTDYADVPCVDLYLTSNYRSQANILSAAFDVISHNHDVIRRPLQAMRQDVDLSQMVTVVDPTYKVLESNDAKRRMLATYEKLGALPKINQYRQKVLGDLIGTRNVQLSEIEPDKPKTLCSMKPIVVHVSNADIEAQFVVSTILDIQKINPQASIAVLYRSHYASSKLEDELLRAEVPYRVVGSVGFFERKEIQDALAYMRLRVNPDDDLALRRVINVPPRKFGAKRMEFLEALARRDHCSLFQALVRNSDNEYLYKRNRVNEFVQNILELNDTPLKDAAHDFELLMVRSGYEEWLKQQGEDERLDNLSMLKKHVVDYVDNQGEEVNLADFLYSVLLLTEADEVNQNIKEVQLMTVHTSKGLEFDYVFIISVNETIFPSRQAISSNNLDEERRLMYVAMTRARKQLFITEAGGCIYMFTPGTLQHGQNSTVKLERNPSRFLKEIEANHLSELGAELLKQRESEKVRNNQQQSEDTTVLPYQQAAQSLHNNQLSELLEQSVAQGFKFPEGAVIKHAVFGEGVIKACDDTAGEYEIYFNKVKRTRRITASVANRNLQLVKMPENSQHLQQGTKDSVKMPNSAERASPIPHGVDEAAVSRQALLLDAILQDGQNVSHQNVTGQALVKEQGKLQGNPQCNIQGNSQIQFQGNSQDNHQGNSQDKLQGNEATFKSASRSVLPQGAPYFDEYDDEFYSSEDPATLLHE